MKKLKQKLHTFEHNINEDGDECYINFTMK